MSSSFPCRPSSPTAVCGIAEAFADQLEMARSSTLLLPERSRLVALLTKSIESGDIALTASASPVSREHVCISASLITHSLQHEDDGSLKPRTTAIHMHSSFIEETVSADTPILVGVAQ